MPKLSFAASGLYLRSQLQEEAQFTDFRCFLHDVDAKKIVQNNCLEDEVATTWMRSQALQYRAKVREFLWGMLLRRAVELIHERRHTVKAGAFFNSDWRRDL